MFERKTRRLEPSTSRPSARTERELEHEAARLAEDAYPIRGAPLPARGPHHPLPAQGSPAPVVGAMSARLGFDLSNVRIHAEPPGVGQARAANAWAVAQGADIHVAAEAWQPQTQHGRHLLAHELAHVAQQRAGYERSLDALDRGGQPPAATAGALPAVPLPAAARRYAVSAAPPSIRSQRCSGCSRGCSLEEGPEEAPTTAATTPPATTPPTVAAPTPIVRGYTGAAPEGTLRIAWTVDDGPIWSSDASRDLTTQMDAALGSLPGTWYIQRSKLGSGSALTTKLTKLKALQDAGNEIAIHSFSERHDHAAWFPQGTTAAPAAYATTADAMADLRAFHGLLAGAGIQARFVRMPTGEIGELTVYLNALKVANPSAVARQILDGTPVTDPEAAPVQADYELVKSTLASLGLHLWAGGAGANELPGSQGMTWEAESSGVAARTDNFIPSATQEAAHPGTKDKFAGMIRVVKTRSSHTGSLVVLAHDTTAADITEVTRDLGEADRIATSEKVRLEFYTMSGLYQVVRGAAP